MIGVRMQDAARYVRTHPGCAKIDAARYAGPYGSLRYGYQTINRALRAGLILALPGFRKGAYALYAIPEDFPDIQPLGGGDEIFVFASDGPVYRVSDERDMYSWAGHLELVSMRRKGHPIGRHSLAIVRRNGALGYRGLILPKQRQVAWLDAPFTDYAVSLVLGALHSGRVLSREDFPGWPLNVLRPSRDG